MKKEDLRNGMIIEKSNGQRGIYHDGLVVDLNGKFITNLKVYDDNLIAKGTYDSGIIKVFDSNLKLIFENKTLIERIKSSRIDGVGYIEGFSR